MVVGIARAQVMLPDCHSLKEKRAVLRRMKDRVHDKFNAAIAEVADNDLWQSGVLGFAVVANERHFVESMVETIITFIGELGDGRILADDREIIDYGDSAPTSEVTHWEPEEPSPMPARRPGPGSGRRPRLRIPVRGR